MSAGEFRRCPLTGDIVVMAPQRAERPAAILRWPEPPDDPAACPFCPGQEHQTPPETYRAAVGDGWRTRAFPNRYPAVAPNAAVAGRHEVVVATPDHHATLGRLGAEQFAELLAAWRDRLAAFDAEPQWRTRFVFHNQGAAAGASQRHPHSQAIALPFVGPDDPQQWGAFTAADPLGRTLAAERADGRRLVDDSLNGGCAWCPYASRFAGEVWFAPAAPQRFAALDVPSTAASLAPLLHAIEAEAPALNLMLHSPPPGHGGRWLLRIVPRLAGIAGLELGTGVYVNPLLPETAAARLRARIASHPAP